MKEDMPHKTGDDKDLDELLITEQRQHKEELMSCLERSTGEIAKIVQLTK